MSARTSTPSLFLVSGVIGTAVIALQWIISLSGWGLLPWLDGQSVTLPAEASYIFMGAAPVGYIAILLWARPTFKQATTVAVLYFAYTIGFGWLLILGELAKHGIGL